MELINLTIDQAHQGLINKEFSASELTRAYLNQIKEQDKKISAFLTVCEKPALLQAQEIDEKISKGDMIDLLAGIPVAVKDIIVVKDIKATAGSKILENYIAPYDATCIKKLKEKGAVIIGKTNMDEFAMGSSTERSAFFPTKNPHDPTRVPGGSSGGSAAAVASDMSCYALGSDTCGSIRQPAGFCGVVGFKPSYGAVSRYGLIAMASSLDHIGPFAKTVDDCRIIFDAISDKDNLDSTSVKLPENDFSDLKIKGMKIGIPKEYFAKGIDEGVEKIVRNAIKKYEDSGAIIEQVSLPYSTEHALAVYYIIMPSEVSANLARYDGIKYGHSAKKAKDLIDFYLKTRAQGFGDEVRRRIMLGTYALSSGYYEAYYLRAQKIRTLIKQDFERVFKKVDVLMAPIAPTPAFKLGEKMTDPLSMYLTDIYMAAVNLAGLPAISLPCGKVDNLPVGLQIIGKYLEDKKVIKIAKFL